MAEEFELSREPAIIEAELQIPGILIQVGSFVWKRNSENVHRVDEYTISMLLSAQYRLSQGYFEIEDNRRAFVDIGDFIMVPAGMPLRARASGGPIRFVRCRYAPECFARLTGISHADWTPEILKHCLNIRDARLHEAMTRLAHEVLAPGYNVEVLAKGLGTTLAVDLMRHLRAIDPEPDNARGGLAPWQLRRIVGYIDSHPGSSANVDELAALCGISCRHLRRLFKQTTNQTLHDYVRHAWLAKAKSLLGDTTLPLKEITAQIGFPDPASFSMAFRRATGIAPRTFRKQRAAGGLPGRAPQKISGF